MAYQDCPKCGNPDIRYIDNKCTCSRCGAKLTIVTHEMEFPNVAHLKKDKAGIIEFPT